MKTRFRLLAVSGVALGLLGGIYLAAADPSIEQPKPTVNPAPLPVATTKVAADVRVEPADETLSKPLKKLKLGENSSITLKNLFAAIEDETDLVVRVEVGAFRRLGFIDGLDNDGQARLDGPLPSGGAASLTSLLIALQGNEGATNLVERFLKQTYDTKVILPRRADRLPLRDVLAEALSQVTSFHWAPGCTFQLRESQLVIIPAFYPPTKPGADVLHPAPQQPLPGQDVEDLTVLPTKIIWEQIHGGVVSVAVKGKPLTDILADLRKQTGANIVLDPRSETAGKGGDKKLTISLNDVRLYDAVRVIADMAELKMVYAGNVYYITTIENARLFQQPPPVRPVVHYNQPGQPYIVGNPAPQGNPPMPPNPSPAPAPNPSPAPAPKVNPPENPPPAPTPKQG